MADKKPLTGSGTILVCVALLVGAGAGVLLVARQHLRSASSPPKQTAFALSEPVSLEDARQQLSIPLPDGAANILYGQYAELSAHEFVLRFEAPVEVCKSHAEVLINRHNRDNPGSRVSGELREITEPPPTILAQPPLNITWFDIDNIRNGVVTGEVGSHQPRIWIDTERGVFYYIVTD